MSRVTQVDVAHLAGCDAAQVSRTLRGLAGVAPVTRRRIMAAVRKLGYRADPALSALADERWSRGARRQGRIAIVFPAPTHEPQAAPNPRIRRLLRAARGVARRLGYELLEMHRERFADDAELETELLQRNVRGIIVGFHRDPQPMALDWERFAVVQLGAEDSLPGIHRIIPDYRQVFALAVECARSAGYRRIGFCSFRYGNKELDDVILSAALLQRLRLVEDGLPRLPVFRYRDEDADHCRGWFRSERPDCIIATHPEPHEWLGEDGIRMPRDCGFIHILGRGRPDEPDLSCVDRRHEELGREAVGLLHQLLQHRHYGPTRFPITHLVSGKWYPGTTI